MLNKWDKFNNMPLLLIEGDIKMDKKDKLLEIFRCINSTCNSSVKIFDTSRGHTSRSVGFAAYEERQKSLLDLSLSNPDIIELICRKGGHNYFKFEGRTIKIISSSREVLSPNVFEKNICEKGEYGEFDMGDNLLRVIYKTDYDLENNEALILECHFLEIDRNTNEILDEIDILYLSKERAYFVEAIEEDIPEEVQIPEPGLVGKENLKVPVYKNND